MVSIIQAIRAKGFGLRARQNTGDRAPEAQGEVPATTGVITTIWDKGFGFILRDKTSSRTDLYFHRTVVDGSGFDGLRVGQRVSFDEEADPRDRNHQRAVNVRPTGERD
jgi:CspA family cold shock protein